MSSSKRRRCRLGIGAVLVAFAGHAADTGPQGEYQRRAADRDVALFQSLDLDRDGAVSRAEAKGDLNFEPRFDAMDVNRDGLVTAAELQRFIEAEYGLRVELRPN